MFKGKGYDPEESFKKIIGIGQNADYTEALKDCESVSKYDSKHSSEPLNSWQRETAPTPQSPKTTVSIKARTAGRPKVNREIKKRYNFTIRPSLYELASQKAAKEGRSLSEVLSSLLEKYIE